MATAGDLIRLPMGIPHGLFNKSDQPMKCFFWVTPTRKLYDLFWAIHGMKEQKPAGRGRALRQARGGVPAAAGGVTFLSLAASEERASRIVDCLRIPPC